MENLITLTHLENTAYNTTQHYKIQHMARESNFIPFFLVWPKKLKLLINILVLQCAFDNFWGHDPRKFIQCNQQILFFEHLLLIFLMDCKCMQRIIAMIDLLTNLNDNRLTYCIKSLDRISSSYCEIFDICWDIWWSLPGNEHRLGRGGGNCLG